MSRLPVIAGFGGFGAAGRSSFHHAYRRMVIGSLAPEARQQTLVGLAAMMKLVTYTDNGYADRDGARLSEADIEARFGQQILNSTLVRRIESRYHDVDRLHWHKQMEIGPAQGQSLGFITTPRQLPEPLPPTWTVSACGDGQVRVEIRDNFNVKVDSFREAPVKAAGQLPSGFDPGELYNSRFHPRALQMTIAAASDAIHSLGLAWRTVVDAVPPDAIGVYAGSAMSQLDDAGFGGMLQARLKGGRVSTKQCPLGLNTMPADFINAYVLGSVGVTGSTTGACASFLYNLRLAVEDIQSGRRRVVVVGNSEAPITPEILDGYGTMGALATDDNLKYLDAVDTVDYRRASRPFGENCGFTMAESAQYVVLMDDELALQLGADIHGAATDVFVNADGYKKSISAPGPGNYITMAKAVAAARAIVGDEAVRTRSFIQAHGSSTPQNRVSESHIFDQVAGAFAIRDWPVAAVKAYLGHSLAPASADQLMASLGVFAYGFIPGIKTIDKVADDVYAERLHIPTADVDRGVGGLDVAFLNSKGFGGNNATATILSPQQVERMLRKRYGDAALASYAQKREHTRAAAAAYDRRATRGDFQTIYHFGRDMIDETALGISSEQVRVPGFNHPIDLRLPNRYADMT
ncbi:beta-ketoacyl synthase [Exilibacterium tricleocarpae]|uniref:Beta-ketoacyl synthase n=1 Tax=Exilibacterium tricleocarpae TaxID=2591008 RepID=A0A545T882_9GAMM|nr:beta-ketoacyl synthase [Exilibacterium tricleocarpae]TQV73436.1 beta-ketoacyl synthase [Exilibacterium tricleocarpae]